MAVRYRLVARILLADDNELLRSALREILKSAGHEVIEASTGRLAVELYHREKPAAVVTDIFMPDRDGLDILIELVQLHARVVVMSGGGDRGDVTFLEDAKAFGACAVLQKPFRREALLDAVRVALGVP